MEKSKVILGLKEPCEFSLEERKLIVEEYLQRGCTKREIWKKYTGQAEEKGYLLRWMRQLGYDIATKWVKLSGKSSIPMSNPKANESVEHIELKEKIAQLEKALVQSELRVTALDTMIEVAEKELKINIRKKSYTKQSPK